VPTLILPPQAGHDSCIVDYSDEQSQVKVALAAGLERLWSLDWVGATVDTRNAGIEDYLAVVDRAVDDLGGRVNLVGDCQGGWLAAIYAALRPSKVHTLTLAGAPIDFHAGTPLVGEWTRALAPRDDLTFYRTVVAASGGVLKGEYMLAGFVLLKPENEAGKQLQLLANLDDDMHVTRYQAFEDWFKHTQDIAGAFYLWIVEHLFRDNELIQGRLAVGGERVDLGAITCPLNLLAGATDHITPAPQVFAAAGAVGTPPRDIVEMTTTGGHLGLFMGGEALREYWPPLLARVAERSHGDVSAPASRARAAAATPRREPPVPAP
jgi:poly(3-hydroxyalkanoate) synthetase